MTPLIISTRRSDETLRAIRSVTMVGNVSTFLTSSIGDPTGTQPTAGLTPRTTIYRVITWSGRPDLNRRPLPPQGSALPPALRPDDTHYNGNMETRECGNGDCGTGDQ